MNSIQAPQVLRGRIRQSVCRWCFDAIPLVPFAEQVAAIGLKGIDLVEPAQWDVLKRFGLICTMTPSHGIVKGLNDPANHEECLTRIRNAIEATAAARFPNVICFSGNRTGKISDEAGLRNCNRALKRVIRLAEKKKVTLCMEMLNSKVNHPRYMCDSTEWGADLVKRVGSERFKLLYDVYHMQVQEGNIIATIQKQSEIIGHYHTAGVPGRGEIDGTQELYYPAILRTIVQSGFKGFVAHEFQVKQRHMDALRRVAEVCDV
jgi:hydroxypyruvate isomerase